jgi:hypothetical protein
MARKNATFNVLRKLFMKREKAPLQEHLTHARCTARRTFDSARSSRKSKE